MGHPLPFNRRGFLRGMCGALGGAVTSDVWVAAQDSPPAVKPGEPARLASGPQLFLDDYAIQDLEGLVRQVRPPQRLAAPVLDSKTFGTTQPYLTVLRDTEGLFRIWYNHGPAIWHAESRDGITFGNPREAWNLPRSYGCSLLDDGPSAADPQRRYKLANWRATREREDKPGDDGGMWVGFSPDGLTWTDYDRNPVLLTWPEGHGKFTRHGVGDTVDVFYDALRKRYVASFKVHALAGDGYAPAPKAGKVFRRLVGMSTSDNFLHWEKPWRILAPDQHDQGLLEFYGMGGLHQRGALTIGLVRVLRDDLPCDPGGPVDGIGYTALATTRDGVTWQRSREEFLPRNPAPGSWDHAMSWMSAAVDVGDEVYFYYGGYARGHKIAAQTERQIGLARMRRDRYLALVPQHETGTLRTPAFFLQGSRLTLNVDASRGAVTARLLDAAGRPLNVLGSAESQAVATDALAAEVRWPKSLAAAVGQTVRLEFTLRGAALFGFEFRPARA